MNTKHIIAAAALVLLGTSAFAGDEFDPARGAVSKTSAAPAQVSATARPNDHFATEARSVTTRAQVKAELARARQDGSMVSFDTGSQYAQAPKAANAAAESRAAK